MSDLANLFAQRRQPSTPIKRLFFDDLSTSKKTTQTRSREPNKSVRKNKVQHQSHISLLKAKDFAKRYINKSDIKKEIHHYNQQILLTFMRKMFFMMGGVILFNIIFTSAHQYTIISNMLLALLFIDINLENELVGKTYFSVGKQIARMIAYCINFYVLFLEIHPDKSIGSHIDTPIFIISANAALNYIAFGFCHPFAAIEKLNNFRQPYLGPYQRLKVELIEFRTSLSAVWSLHSSIILSNLIYWLFVVGYIVFERSSSLLNDLVSIQTLIAFCLTTFLLYILMYAIQKINTVISIDLLSSNKKIINLSILRLDSQKINNEAMLDEIIKYVWKNSQVIWDVEFISHLYSINYDVLGDYLNFQLTKINQKIIQITRFLESQTKANKIHPNMRFSFPYRVKSNIQQIIKIHQLASYIMKKSYLLYVVEHIAYFGRFTDDFPINTQPILKKILKIDSSLKQLSQIIKFSVLKQSICRFCIYFDEKILNPLLQ